MADLEGQSGSESATIPTWMQYTCRILALAGAGWTFIGGLASLMHGGLFILTALIRVTLAIFAFITEASIFCTCFKDNPTFQKVEEKLSVVNYLHKAIVYLAVPLICVAITYYPSHLVVTFVFWFAAGFNGYAAYLLWKNKRDGTQVYTITRSTS